MHAITTPIEVVKTVTEIEDHVQITLTPDEADTLLAITAWVGGDPYKSPRKHIDSLREALGGALGKNWYDTTAYGMKSGTGISFDNYNEGSI